MLYDLIIIGGGPAGCAGGLGERVAAQTVQRQNGGDADRVFQRKRQGGAQVAEFGGIVLF